MAAASQQHTAFALGHLGSGVSSTFGQSEYLNFLQGIAIEKPIRNPYKLLAFQIKTWEWLAGCILKKTGKGNDSPSPECPARGRGDASLFVFRFNCDRDSPAHRKAGDHFAPAGLQYLDQIIKNHIGHVLMESPFVPKRPEI